MLKVSFSRQRLSSWAVCTAEGLGGLFLVPSTWQVCKRLLNESTYLLDFLILLVASPDQIGRGEKRKGMSLGHDSCPALGLDFRSLDSLAFIILPASVVSVSQETPA